MLLIQLIQNYWYLSTEHFCIRNPCEIVWIPLVLKTFVLAIHIKLWVSLVLNTFVLGIYVNLGSLGT